MLALKAFRSRKKSLADLLPYAALIEPDIVLCKDGTLLAAYKISGKDTESCTEDELSAISIHFSNAVKILGSGFMLHVDAIRIPAQSYFDPKASHFPDPVSAMLDEIRRKNFSEGYLTTQTILSVCYKPNYMDNKLKNLATDKKEQNFLEQSLDDFKKNLIVFEDALELAISKECKERLGSTIKDNKIFSPLLGIIQLCLTGENYIPHVPHTPMYLDAIMGGQDLIGGLNPKIADKYIASIGLDGLPSESFASMLSVISNLPFECRFSTRFICMDHFEALKTVDFYRKTWAQNIYRFFDKIFNKVNPRPDRDALAMSQDAEIAYANLQGGYFAAGYYTANVVLLDADKDDLIEKVRLVRRLIMSLGFNCRLETINALEAWLSTHPGNSYANVRRPIISSLNLADFLPLASTWTGLEHNPCPFYPMDSPALMQCATDSTTPYWLNLHVGDVGHTLILGPTGSGKSTLLAKIAEQFMRYKNATVFAFDKGESLYALSKLLNGSHYNIGGQNTPNFSPLADIDDELSFSWACEWISTLCSIRMDKITLPIGYSDAINTAMKQVKTWSKDNRTLTQFMQIVQHQEIKDALRHYTISGAMGSLIDAEYYEWESKAKFTVFEIEKLMNMGNMNSLPILLYLFYFVEKNLKGQPALLMLDEAWLMLGHPVFREKIREWLKVMRKNNCAVVIATQSLSDADRSGILDVLNESCLTKIYLPNEKAQEEGKALYQKFGLNDRMIEIIASSRPKREYYVVQPQGQRLINLELSPVELCFCGVSSKDDVAKFKELEAGENCLADWLKYKKIPEHDIAMCKKIMELFR